MLVSLVGFYYDTEKEEVIACLGNDNFILNHLTDLDPKMLNVIQFGWNLETEKDLEDLFF